MFCTPDYSNLQPSTLTFYRRLPPLVRAGHPFNPTHHHPDSRQIRRTISKRVQGLIL